MPIDFCYREGSIYHAFTSEPAQPARSEAKPSGVGKVASDDGRGLTAGAS